MDLHPVVASFGEVPKAAPKSVRLLVRGGGHSEIILGAPDPIRLALRVVDFSERFGVKMAKITLTVFRELKR